MQDIQKLESAGDYNGVINAVRERVAKDRRAFTDSSIKAWCGRRWRNLFINEAVKDETALKAASGGLFSFGDKRGDRQKIAERYLRGDGPNEWNVEMPLAQVPALKNVTLLFCPGMLNGLLPVRAFQEALPAIEQKHGWPILRADLHPMRGCEANIADLEAALERGTGLAADCSVIPADRAKKPGDVFIISYSKGTPDVLHLLVRHPELKSRVRAIFNWAGAPGGSYLADDIYNSVKDLPIDLDQTPVGRLLTTVSPVIQTESMRRLPEFDIKTCVHDVTTPVRSAFMAEHRDFLDGLGIPFFNITGSTNALEVPYFQIQGVNQLNRYDANNDMQVTQDQAKVKMPMATDLAMLHGHHWDVSYSPFPNRMRFGSPHLDHPFPKEAAPMAMFLLAAELGLID